MVDKLDIIIFGATGFTGKHCIYEGVKLLKDFKWGIAGRSKDKLEAVLMEVGTKAGADLSEIPIIIAEADDDESLVKMAEQCKIVVNCCGPYRFYGEAVVKACVEAGTHHVDLSEETKYFYDIQLQFNDQAKEKGVYIVSACGFDSIPADLGTIFMEQNFEGDVNSIEIYLTIPKPDKPVLSYGSWKTFIYILANWREFIHFQKKLTAKLPKMIPALDTRPIIFKSTLVQGNYCVPIMQIEQYIVSWSQQTLFELYKKRPVQVQCFFTVKSLFALVTGITLFLIIFVLTQFQRGREMLLNILKSFRGGYISDVGLSEETKNDLKFTMIFHGLGWTVIDEKDRKTGQYLWEPTKKLITKVTGPNPRYGTTCVTLLLSAITILTEKEKMPESGGVFPPGAAFLRTNLISELCKNGFTFEVVDDDERPDETIS